VTNQEYLEAVQWAYDEGYVNASTESVWDNLDGSDEELLDVDDLECEIRFDGAGTFYLAESQSDFAQNAYPNGYDPADHPVKEVTWFGLARYCDWLSLQAGLPRAYKHTGDWSCNGGDPYGATGYRLPTDAEWEYAAQYNDDRVYPWGEENPDCTRANYCLVYPGCVGWTSPVGSYPDAPEALGLSDMAGNVWELCNDWRNCNPGTAPVTDPTGPDSGMVRIRHGGSWADPRDNLRCACRDDFPPTQSLLLIGFRIARTVPTSSGVGGNQGHSQFRLSISNPNPFTRLTQIDYALPHSSLVQLAIYDATGRLVRTLIKGPGVAGSHSIEWDGTDDAGTPVEAGAYFYRLTAGDRGETKRMLLVR
jgi:formylglycine-generating enzyme required for sulfatase activity